MDNARLPPRQPLPVPPRRRRSGLLLWLLAIVMFGLAGRLVLPATLAKVQAGTAATPAAAAAHQAVPVDATQLASRLNGIINGSALETGVAIIDLSNNKTYDYGLSSTPYIAASTAKLLSASLFLHQVEQGSASLDAPLAGSTAADQLQKMIVNSDNTAWQAFNAQLGHPALLQYADSLGLSAYDPATNLITPDDLARLLATLYQGRLLDAAHTQLLLSYMKQANETQYIGAAIPPGVKFYHKAGYLDDRAMDGAIIDNGRHPYVLVIFTKDPSGSYDQTAGQQVFHDLTTATLQAFAR